MEKVTLKLHEFYALDAELNGVMNQQTGEVIAKVLLGEKIKLTTKYWLTDLSKKAAAEKEAVEKLKEDFTDKKAEIKKLEETDPKDMYLEDLNELKKKFK
jgi:hypothetical protein